MIRAACSKALYAAAEKRKLFAFFMIIALLLEVCLHSVSLAR